MRDYMKFESKYEIDQKWGVNTSDWSFKKTSLDFVNYQNGSAFILQPGKSIFRALIACYGNLICENPGGSVRITNANRL